MFSDITEAWEKDPVREITNKLNKNSHGKYQYAYNHRFSEKSPTDVLNLSNTNRRNTSLSNTRDQFSDASLDLLSESTIDLKNDDFNSDYNSDYSSYAPVDFNRKNNFKKSHKKQYSKHHRKKYDNSNSNSNSTIGDSKCDFSVTHLKKCDPCYKRLKKLINKKVQSKMDDAMLDYKMKMLQSNIPIQATQPVSATPSHTHLSDSWKETLIIIIGAIVAIFLIFLITKSLSK